MGIIRNPLKCMSCGAVTVTRTATGLFPPYDLKFPCPGCGVEIRYTMKGDKSRTRYSFTTPVNGRWVKSEKGSVAKLTFDPDRVAPRDMTNVFSPFLADVFRFSPASREAYAKEEGMRRAWRSSHWPWIQRLTVHFDNRNARLFDREAKLKADSPGATSWATRLGLLTFFRAHVPRRLFSVRELSRHILGRRSGRSDPATRPARRDPGSPCRDWPGGSAPRPSASAVRPIGVGRYAHGPRSASSAPGDPRPA
jgi:predicted RNA-binding Zn-ribbon protein involved in translation (DUF1610 family)